MKAINCLLITTSNNRLGDTLNKTGVRLEDLAAPYYVFRDAGEYVTIASPKGGQIPLDPICRTKEEETGDTKRFQGDSQAMYHFFHSLPLKEVSAEHFDLAFIAGGYGAMWDFPERFLLSCWKRNCFLWARITGRALNSPAMWSLMKISSRVRTRVRRLKRQPGCLNGCVPGKGVQKTLLWCWKPRAIRWYRNYAVAKILTEYLESLPLKYPGAKKGRTSPQLLYNENGR
jgi:hypothetical protein